MLDALLYSMEDSIPEHLEKAKNWSCRRKLHNSHYCYSPFHSVCKIYDRVYLMSFDSSWFVILVKCDGSCEFELSEFFFTLWYEPPWFNHIISPSFSPSFFAFDCRRQSKWIRFHPSWSSEEMLPRRGNSKCFILLDTICNNQHSQLNLHCAKSESALLIELVDWSAWIHDTFISNE